MLRRQINSPLWYYLKLSSIFLNWFLENFYCFSVCKSLRVQKQRKYENKKVIFTWREKRYEKEKEWIYLMATLNASITHLSNVKLICQDEWVLRWLNCSKWTWIISSFSLIPIKLGFSTNNSNITQTYIVMSTDIKSDYYECPLINTAKDIKQTRGEQRQRIQEIVTIKISGCDLSCVWLIKLFWMYMNTVLFLTCFNEFREIPINLDSSLQS